MKRYILTGAPGAGKTSLIKALESQGFSVVHEAATDIIFSEQASGVIAPWEHPDFIEQILDLQIQRQKQAYHFQGNLMFFDRSPFCTYALALYQGFQPSVLLVQELDRLRRERYYDRHVFFVENLGFCEPTEARKISYDDSLRFEKIHAEVYVKFGFECIAVPKAPLEVRVDILQTLLLEH